MLCPLITTCLFVVTCWCTHDSGSTHDRVVTNMRDAGGRHRSTDGLVTGIVKADVLTKGHRPFLSENGDSFNRKHLEIKIRRKDKRITIRTKGSS